MRVLIVDDEPLARRRLARMLQRLPGVEVAGEAADGIEALECIRTLRPDCVLLDVRMPGLDGIALATSGGDLPPIVFTTAFDEYAVRAFETGAVDYLLKPVEAPRLEAALARVRQRALANPAHLERLLNDVLRRDEPVRITARAGNVVRVFEAREIARFRASDRYTIFKHEEHEYVLDDSLAMLEARLPRFVRVHRSELLNLDQVRALRFEDDGAVAVLADGQVAPVSRRALPDLKRRLGMTDDPSS